MIQKTFRLLVLVCFLCMAVGAQDFSTRKALDSVEDFTIDWSSAAANNAVASSVWVVPGGITKVTDTRTATKTIVRLSGGTPGGNYTLRNRVTLTDGQVLSVSLQITIKSS